MQSIKSFVTVVTLCDIFNQDINDFLALIFSRKKSIYMYAYIFAAPPPHLIANFSTYKIKINFEKDW